MEDSIDCLGCDERHLEAMRGRVLSTEEDSELNALVAEAAALAETPIALISLVLRRSQYFRAAYGLPADLRITRSTDRSVSFCQLVVRDQAPLIVSHASQDPRVPQELVKRYGIEAYIGVPVRVAGTVVGSVCAIDLKPREFTDSLLEKLAEIGERASLRLTSLASEPAPQARRVNQAAGPAFAEMRNALMGVSAGALGLSRVAMELEGLGRLVDPALSSEERERVAGAMRDSPKSIDDLRSIAGELRRSFERIYDGVRGLEALVQVGGESELATCLAAADRLAAHHTKLIGGTEWDTVSPVLRVRSAPSVVVAIATATLSELSLADLQATGGLRIAVAQTPEWAELRFSLVDDLPGHYESAALHLQELLSLEPGISVLANDRSLTLRLAVQERQSTQLSA